MNSCKRCGEKTIGTIINLADPEIGGAYCVPCYNKVIAGKLGIDFEHIDFAPLTLKDDYGKPHTFEFEMILVPPGISIRAFERKTNGVEGYRFEILGERDQSCREIHAELVNRIKRGLARRHLTENDWDGSFSPKDIVRGRIDYDNSSDEPKFVIDGMTFSLQELGRMMLTYEGFQFRLEFVDPSDEVL